MAAHSVVQHLKYAADAIGLQIKALPDAAYLIRRAGALLLLFLISSSLSLQPRAMAQQSAPQGAIVPITTSSSDAMLSTESLPDAPSATGRQIESEPHSPGFLPPTLRIQPEPPSTSPKVIDRQFITLHLLELGAVILDIESTQRGLAHGGSEGNPIAGRHPSRMFQYGVSMPLTFGFACWSHYLKKNAPHSRRWQIIPLVATGIHGAAAVHNFAVGGHR